jgi:hypothetical protein
MEVVKNQPEQRPVTVGDQQLAWHATEQLRHIRRATLPVIGDSELRYRLNELISLAQALAHYVESPAWKRRTRGDTDAYLQYVQLSVAAVVQGDSMPANVTPPNIGRRDTEEVWEPDPRPSGWQ